MFCLLLYTQLKLIPNFSATSSGRSNELVMIFTLVAGHVGYQRLLSGMVFSRELNQACDFSSRVAR